MQPTSIATSTEPPGLILEWEDGLKKQLSFSTLRKECPCALCQGERTPLDPLPDALPVAKHLPPQALVCKDMSPIGGYAISFQWGDGHNSGIYSFEYLRAMAEGIGEEVAK